MVLLKYLNKECAHSAVANAIPAQVACRLLGNSLKPCFLHALCKQCGKKGVWLFYTAIAAAGVSLFILTYWFLTITRLNKILAPLANIALKPAVWLVECCSGLAYFFKNLPF